MIGSLVGRSRDDHAEYQRTASGFVSLPPRGT
jgi:hypothetical protein